MKIEIIVPGEPVAKARPRATTIGGKPRLYTPKKTASYENLIAAEAARVFGDRPLMDGPIFLEVTCYRSIPRSWSKKKQAAAAACEIYPTTRPDADNFLKAICDGLNQIIWVDDSLCVSVSLHKRYSLKPCTVIVVASMEGTDAATSEKLVAS